MTHENVSVITVSTCGGLPSPKGNSGTPCTKCRISNSHTSELLSLVIRSLLFNVLGLPIHLALVSRVERLERDLS